MLKKFNSYTVDIFINGPLIFLVTVVDISGNSDEPLLNLTTLIFLWTRLDLVKSPDIMPLWWDINSLAPGKFELTFIWIISKLILVTGGWGISCEIAHRWMNFTDKSSLVQVMAWCHQATSHYLSQCRPRSMSPHGITRPQWVKLSGYVESGPRFSWLSSSLFVFSRFHVQHQFPTAPWGQKCLHRVPAGHAHPHSPQKWHATSLLCWGHHSQKPDVSYQWKVRHKHSVWPSFESRICVVYLMSVTAVLYSLLKFYCYVADVNTVSSFFSGCGKQAIVWTGDDQDLCNSACV